MRLTGPVVLLELPVERLAAELPELLVVLRLADEPELLVERAGAELLVVERETELLVVERAGAEELEVLRETLEPELVVVLAAPLLLTRLLTVAPLVERFTELLELELVAVLRLAVLLELELVAVLRLAELLEFVVAVLRLAELLEAVPVLRLAPVVAVERLAEAELLLALEPVLVEVAL